MMALNELATIRALIASKTAITNLTSTRIWVGEVPENIAAGWKTPQSVQPAIQIEPDEGDSESDPYTSQVPMTLTFFGATQAAAVSLAETVKGALDNISETINNDRVGCFWQTSPPRPGRYADMGWEFATARWQALFID